ncbi:MAG: bifunctional demethylmenaquinone methyltransferase/2-methoxy-6-polyprenyl-1,4-benzoquinol methylase UbiE [Candidatus Hydrogenedentota bacterium]
MPHHTAHTPETPSRRRSWQMFDRIAWRYDLLNRLLSLGRDVAWRKRLANHLPPGEQLHVLDVGTGTADVLLFLHAACSRIGLGVGVDMSFGMLGYGMRKVRECGEQGRFRLVRGDAVDLPVRANAFDAATIAFGIRNVADAAAGLREMYRALKPGGRVLILEFSLPRNRLVRWGYLVYFRHVLPRIGGLVSGDAPAYRYLNETVETFPYGEAFCTLLRGAGFREVKALPYTFGIATLYIGEK